MHAIGPWETASPWWGRSTLLAAYLSIALITDTACSDEILIDMKDYGGATVGSAVTALLVAAVWLTLFSHADASLLDSALRWISWIPTPWATGSVWSRVTAGSVWMGGLSVAWYAVLDEF